MTKIEYGKNWVCAIGHAGSSEDAKIACDGITTLMHTLHLVCGEMVAKDPNVPLYYVKVTDENRCHLDFVLQGLRMLRDEFPEQIDLSEH